MLKLLDGSKLFAPDELDSTAFSIRPRASRGPRRGSDAMADRDAALRELLGEIGDGDGGAGSDPSTSAASARVDGDDAAGGDATMMHHLNLRDLTLDASSAANAIDGLDLDLVKYADHDVVRDIMRSDVTDLKQRASSVEAKLQSVELESIKDYVAESDNLVALHGQIEGCDAILREMESLLLGFKNDLGKISSEIKSLQDQSSTMGTKLRNRKAAEYSLGAFVEDVALAPDLVLAIADGEVSEAYLRRLVELDRHLEFMRTDATASASAAARDVAPELERLRAKAAAK